MLVAGLLRDGSRPATAALLTRDRRDVLRSRIRIVVATTISWNVVETMVTLIAGHAALSAAFIGFGSILEVLLAAAAAWQFTATDHEKLEKVVLRGIARSSPWPCP
ncbi:hypothetical protein [Brevibacterium permense]|uniref:hypothetical protein n=1 Tax=Brevibacterium permense TaxID=234834 RepID=UPI003F7EC96C